MSNKQHFVIIDDSQTILMTYTLLLQQAGHDVTSFTNCDEALKQIQTLQPDCILCDLMLPGMDSIEFINHVRKECTKQPAFIVISGKQFEYDRKRVMEAGANGYMTKPINQETFVNEVLGLIHETMTLKFWGVRGTLPVAGQRSLRYGGNTNCVTLNIANKQNFIFDAGSGIKELSNYLVKEKLFPYKAKIFISHPHYDHINGIPFFVPLYMKGNEFEFLGADQGNVTLENYLSKQMDSVYFPVTMSEFSSSVKFHSLREETIHIDGIRVDTMLLNHPGHCLGYRIEYKSKVICYVTDNEIYMKEDKQRYNPDEVMRLIRFIEHADILIIDCTYTDNEYAKKIGWGHSPLSMVVEVAHRAQVKLLCLHHHDPDQSDDDIDAKLEQAKAILKANQSHTECIIPREGDEIVLTV